MNAQELYALYTDAQVAVGEEWITDWGDLTEQERKTWTIFSELVEDES